MKLGSLKGEGATVLHDGQDIPRFKSEAEDDDTQNFVGYSNLTK